MASMLTLVKQTVAALVGFSSGMVIAGAVFAFISVIGVVPRLAQKTGTQEYVKLYEEAITAGGICGALASLSIFSPRVPVGLLGAAVFSLLVGIFYGCLAISLAEVLKVIPILTRRTHIQQGMFFFICAIALGKLAGSVVYYVIPGFIR